MASISSRMRPRAIGSTLSRASPRASAARLRHAASPALDGAAPAAGWTAPTARSGTIRTARPRDVEEDRPDRAAERAAARPRRGLRRRRPNNQETSRSGVAGLISGRRAGGWDERRTEGRCPCLFVLRVVFVFDRSSYLRSFLLDHTKKGAPATSRAGLHPLSHFLFPSLFRNQLQP